VSYGKDVKKSTTLKEEASTTFKTLKNNSFYENVMALWSLVDGFCA
jgi:hypothetical protein